jgi:hypothetical protein
VINPNTTEKSRSEIETTKALGEMQRIAVEQGIKPFDVNEWLSEDSPDSNPEETRAEVDAFLAMLREWRDTPSQRNID